MPLPLHQESFDFAVRFLLHEIQLKLHPLFIISDVTLRYQNKQALNWRTQALPASEEITNHRFVSWGHMLFDERNVNGSMNCWHSATPEFLDQQ